jgi:ribonuclease HI
VKLATDGSVGEENMGAGWAWVEALGGEAQDGEAMVMGEEEGKSSYRPECAAVDGGLEAIGDEKDVDVLVDNQSVLTLIEKWIAGVLLPSPLQMAEADVAIKMLLRIGGRSGRSRFYKIKSHRGEPFNERADGNADRGVEADKVMGVREGSHKVICEVKGHSGVWNPKVTRMVQAQTAKWLGSKVKEGRTTAFLRRKGAGRELLGEWWKQWNGMTDWRQKLALQLVTRTYPSPMQLFVQGLKETSNCMCCGQVRATMEHIQCRCPSTKEARIAAHHKGWRMICTHLRAAGKKWKVHEEEPLWRIKELLEEAAGKRMGVPASQRWKDPRTGKEGWIGWEEWHPDGGGVGEGMREWRPDAHMICKGGKKVVVGEFTRGSDTYEGFEVRHNEYKLGCYKPWLEHLRRVLVKWGWEATQHNWTAGVRGSVPRREWEQHMEEMGVKEKAREKLMKSVLRETLEGGVDVLAAYGVARKEKESEMRERRR